MALVNQPSILPSAFAAEGDKNTIPANNDGLSGLASVAKGFPPITQVPLAQGGLPPQRQDFNGIFNLFSQFLLYAQNGGVYAYSNQLDYQPPAIVEYNNVLYYCKTANGQTTPAGVRTPPDDDYWGKLVFSAQEQIVSFIASVPTYYKRPALMSSNKTTLIIPANTQINIGGKGYYNTSDVVLQASTVGTAAARAGKDVYVYACQPNDEASTEPVFVLSMNSTVPVGYTANNSRKIGGFHCLCVATGTIANNAASGYAAGDIIPNSVWDLLFRADSENEGMAYDENACIWVDIYLPSWDGAQMRSVYGGVIINGHSSFPMYGERFVEYAGNVKKFLLSRDQFQVVAETSNQKTNINGGADPNTTGGHVDTAGRRMVSAGFIEDLTGVLWQWTSDIFGAFNSTGETSWANQGGINKMEQTATVEGNHYLDFYKWQEDGRGTANINIDGTQHLYGDAFGALARALVGGRWFDGSLCGSRSVYLRLLSSIRGSSFSARCGSRPRVVNL